MAGWGLNTWSSGAWGAGDPVTVSISSVLARASVGTLSPSGTSAEIGDAAVGYAGNVGAITTISISGVAGAGAVTTMPVIYGPTLVGNTATGSVGILAARYWTTIDDSQTANWQNITNPQTPSWVNITT